MRKSTALAGLLALSAAASAAFAQNPAQTQPTTTATPTTTQGQAQRPSGEVPGPIDSLSDLQDTGRLIFGVADENGDGQISQKEAIDAANLAVGGFFFRADQNGDGVLSQDEERQARDAFLSSKPWLRYVVETAKNTRPQAGQGQAQPGQPAGSAPFNPIALLNSVIDSNNDKQVQASELRQVVQSTTQGLFEQADTDRNGLLSHTEVNAAMANMANSIAQLAFQQADSDNSGQISEAEFTKSIMEPARVAFRVMDLNHDGQVSPQEAQTMRQVVMSKLRMANQNMNAGNWQRTGTYSGTATGAVIGSPAQPAAIPAQPAANPPR
ncbi:MAG: hypothetical protein U0835_05030 [Isosphaeraceae bacterium]